MSMCLRVRTSQVSCASTLLNVRAETNVGAMGSECERERGGGEVGRDRGEGRMDEWRRVNEQAGRREEKVG